MDMHSFFDKACEYGAIVSNDISKTNELMAEADKLWEKQLRDNPIIKNKMIGDTIDPKRISDAFITEVDHENKTNNRPVIDLVQQGGGMFGIALLGYTYIMERAGIRFHSHGGTSAGAINASFLAAVPNSVYQEKSLFNSYGKHRAATKSEVLTHIISNTKFDTFMDREGIVGFLQKLLFRNTKSWVLWLTVFFFSALFLLGSYFLFSFLLFDFKIVSVFEVRAYDFIIGTFNVMAYLLFCYFVLVQVLGANFGVNSGDAYYNWVDTLLHLMDISNTKELKSRLKESAVTLTKHGKKEVTQPRLVLMTANLTHNKVVKLPEEAGSYWRNPWNINPAAYLRATMSLPFIFHVLTPKMKHYDIIERSNRIAAKAKFVDGGMLSNFPIREFHRTDGKTPSFPTFGVLLSSREQEDENEKKSAFLRYLGSYLKTFRNFYDNDFLINNAETKMLVELVNTVKYNWLNFWMLPEEKKGLFLEGAIAAIKQLEKFNWESYKNHRDTEISLTRFK